MIRSFSIGTLYRYFPDKQSILIALALREREAHRRAMIAAIESEEPGIAQDRAMIRAFLRVFAGRTRARRIAVSALLAQADHGKLAEGFAMAEIGITDAQAAPSTGSKPSY